MKRERNKRAIKDRRDTRQREQRQRAMVQIGAVMVTVLVLAMIGFFTLRVGNSGPDVSAERLELDPILGNPDAPVTVIEYAAYGCDACRQWHEAGIIDQILLMYPDQVRVIYRDMPIILPGWSQSMGEIAQCAFDQGNEAFWSAHDTLFEDTQLGRTSTADALDLVITNNPALDGDTLRECFDANTHARTVRYDMERPEALAIRGTPTWFVNGQQVYSASPQTIIQLIESALGS
ncbi:MAG: DsbA family protein [Anaerolineae bacterium]